MMTLVSMYDTVNFKQFAANDWDFIAAYVNGRFAADLTALRAEFPDARIYQIDVLGTAPGASIKDIETGDLSPADIPRVVAEHHAARPAEPTRLYCNLSTWPAVKGQVGKLPANLRATVRYWIANPTNVAHIVPGADATQWKWAGTYDQSLVNLATWGT